MDLQQGTFLIAAIITLSFTNFTQAQISWVYWSANALYFGLEASAYGYFGNTLYTGGGNNSLQMGENSFWRFSLSSGSDYVSSMNENWSGGCTAYDASSGYVYFFGGVTNDRLPLPYVQVWPVTGTLEGPPVQIPAGIVLGEGIRCVVDSTRTVHLFGGKENTTLHATYSIAADTWSVLAGMPEGKYQHGAALLNDGLIYVFGGVTTGDVVTASVFSYNATNDSWSTKPSLPQVNAVFASTVTNDNSRVYVVGGSNNPDAQATGAYDSVWYFDSDSGNWTVTTSFPCQIKGLAAVISNNILYTVGGRLGNGSLVTNRWKGTISGLPFPSVTPSVSPTSFQSASPSPSHSTNSTPTPRSGTSESSSEDPFTQTTGGKPKQNKDDSIIVGAVLGAIVGTLCLGIIAGVAFWAIRKKRKQPPPGAPLCLELQPTQPTTGYGPIPEPTATPPHSPVPRRHQHSSSESSTSEEDTDDNTKPSKKLSIGKFNIGIKASEIVEGRLLGEGQFGLVYQAVWRSATVVVKKIKLENEKARKEFFHEARLIKQIRPHPNVVQFFGVCEEPLMIVNEYLEGGSLETYLEDKSKQVPIETAMNIIKGIASGMYHLASENIIHRDLAARNVLLTSNLTPKINDFGLSRLLQKSDEYLSNAESLPLKWLAPESMQLSDQVYSEKSDVWSFGITCIEILTRNPPYPTMFAINVVLLTREGKLKPTIPDNCPTGLRKILEMCFVFDSQNRPAFQEICKMMESSNEKL